MSSTGERACFNPRCPAALGLAMRSRLTYTHRGLAMHLTRSQACQAFVNQDFDDLTAQTGRPAFASRMDLSGVYDVPIEWAVA